MTILDALAQPRLLLACLLFGILNLLLMSLEQRLLHAAEATHASTSWLMEHVYLPLARILCVLIFLALAYPTLFGLTEAPGLLELLAAGERRTSTLINLSFLLSLLLPFIPLLGRLPSLVLPLQSLLAAAMLFTWLADASGVNARLWPGGLTTVLIVVWLILGQRLAAWLAHQVGDQWDNGDGERVFYEMVVLLFQLPAILLYTLALGRQLH